MLCLLRFRESGDIVLKICNLMPQDTGIYTCVAVNDHGTASSSASIKVQGKKKQRRIQMGSVQLSFSHVWMFTHSLVQVSQQPLLGLWHRKPAALQWLSTGFLQPAQETLPSPATLWNTGRKVNNYTAVNSQQSQHSQTSTGRSENYCLFSVVMRDTQRGHVMENY